MAGHEIAAEEADIVLPGWARVFRQPHLYILEYLHDLKVRVLLSHTSTHTHHINEAWMSVLGLFLNIYK